MFNFSYRKQNKENGKQKTQYTLTKDTEGSPSILCFHLFLNMLLMLWEETKLAGETHSNTEN